MGMLFHVNTKSPPNASTQFFDLIDGSPASSAPTMPAYQLGLSEVDPVVYGISGGTPGGLTEYVHVQMGKKPPLCLVFNFKLGVCARCNQNYFLYNGGRATPVPNSNPPDYSQSTVCMITRTPGGLIAPDLYRVDFDAMASGMLKIYFSNLEGFRPEVRKLWI